MELLKYNTLEVVKKIVGEIQPQGETRIDEIRFENLQQMCSLVNELVIEIDRVAFNQVRNEASMSKAGKYAQNFLTNTLGISEQ